MLRLVVLVLLMLNVGYFAWGQGWLLPYGWGPVSQREPQRLAQQVRPQALVILGAQEAQPTAAAVSSLTTCWQAGDLDAAQAQTLRALLQAKLPDGAWVMEDVLVPERWMIYMGKYANAVELAKKREQLTSLKVPLEPLSNPALAPGLSLGTFDSEEAANTALQALTRRGVRTARVLSVQPATPRYRLRLPALDPAQQPQLALIKEALAGKSLEACAVTVSK
ncbi:SPOR domain-containing protein [Rhodoferax sp.]|uniref:SPOR domain-containing protein n=1 Tax=Rhodoferax sp. TaxID=50421 RepID=UPI002613B8A2|nr:SPOR domain-containing protein [Rhodoferax sp.]MDD2927096.1 SPOR domain-containing protein [Rhodoferax sp.]